MRATTGVRHENARWALRDRLRAGPGWHGRGLQGLRAGADPLRRDQGARAVAGARHDAGRALPARGALDGGAERPAHHPDLFHRPGKRAAVLRDGVRRRRIAVGPDQARRPPAGRRRAEDPAPVGEGPVGRARPRRDPPRHQAGEPDAEPARPGQDRRLRHRAGEPRFQQQAHRHRRVRRHARLPVAGSLPRQGGRPALGHLRARHRAVRDADRPYAVLRRKPAQADAGRRAVRDPGRA